MADVSSSVETLVRSVLILEDSPIIALDMEQIVFDMGADFVWSCRTCEEAFAALASNEFQFALLDIHLGSQNSLPVAAHLVRSKTPFLFVTGSSSLAGEVLELPDVPRLSKPFVQRQLIAAITEFSRGTRLKAA